MKTVHKGNTILLPIKAEICFDISENESTYIFSFESKPLRLIRLTRKHPSNKWFDQIILTGEQILIGRAHNTEFHSNYISRTHGIFIWSEKHQAFTYTQLGLNPIHIKDPSLTLEKKQIYESEIRLIKNLISELKQASVTVSLVQGLELPTNLTPLAARIGHYKPENTLKGYALLLNVYLHLKPNLDGKTKSEIEKLVALFTNLAEDEKKLWDIDAELSFFSTESPKLMAYINEKIEQLERNNEVYFYAGIKEHFELVRLTKHVDTTTTYHHTLYNAGFEAQTSSSDEHLVNCVWERSVHGNTREEVFRLILAETLKLATNPVSKLFILSLIEKLKYHIENGNVIVY